MGIKIGNIDASYFKVGSDDCSIYLGETLIYSGDTPTPSYKFTATYSDGTSYSAECDSDTTLTTATTRAHTTARSAMTTADIGDCVTSLGYSAFGNCYSLSSVTIPDSVTTIGNDAFYRCSGLTSINIPNSVVSIGSSFEFCYGLTSVTIPNSVTTIGSQAFRYCSGLTSIEIPTSVTDIGLWAFDGCTSLTSVTALATTPPTLSMQAFNNTNNCPIYVPAESVDTYKAANNWSSYASRIQAIPTPTLQWVSFSSGDTIPSGNIYGFSGNSQTVGNPIYNILEIGSDTNNCVTFGHGAPTRAPQFTAYFYLISNGSTSYIDSWEGGEKTFVFSDYSSQGVEEYYYEDGTKTLPFDCQLYIYV